MTAEEILVVQERAWREGLASAYSGLEETEVSGLIDEAKSAISELWTFLYTSAYPEEETLACKAYAAIKKAESRMNNGT